MTHADYPKRLIFRINNKDLDDKTYWEKCPVFTHKSVTANMQSTSGIRWADDEKVDKEILEERLTFLGTGNELKTFKAANIELNRDGKPVNPMEKTGLRGRGILGRWGSNHAADPIIAYEDENGDVWGIVVRRKDTGQYAIAGGFVDPGDTVSRTLRKELGEEAVDADKEFVNGLFNRGLILYQGYVNDPRNTDEAWIETTVCGVLVTKEEMDHLQLKSEDSEHNTDSTKWIKIDPHSKEFNELYADHKLYLLLMKASINGANSERTICEQYIKRHKNDNNDDDMRVILGFIILLLCMFVTYLM